MKIIVDGFPVFKHLAPVAGHEAATQTTTPAKMQTILERFKELEESGVPFDSVTDAHELEHGIARHLRAWHAQRKQVEKDLLTLWTPEEVKVAGLTAPRNPREVLAELEALTEADTAPNSIFKHCCEIRALVRELDCAFEPFFTLLPAPETAEG